MKKVLLYLVITVLYQPLYSMELEDIHQTPKQSYWVKDWTTTASESTNELIVPPLLKQLKKFLMSPDHYEYCNIPKLIKFICLENLCGNIQVQHYNGKAIHLKKNGQGRFSLEVVSTPNHINPQNPILLPTIRLIEAPIPTELCVWLPNEICAKVLTHAKVEYYF